MSLPNRRLGLALFFLLPSFQLLPFSANADEGETLNRIEFNVQVQRETQNDLTTAVMVVEKENADSAALAQDVNKTMTEALKQAKTQTQVRVRSGNYRSYPIQDERRITGWRAEQEMILESEDATALHRLLGILQNKLLLRSIAYTVSPERSAALEDGLTAEALDAFKARATLIAERLGAKSYDIVQLRLDGAMPPPMPIMRAQAMRLQDSAAVAGEPGTSRLTSGVQAVIRLKY
ncbi:MAG: SIMPL domain-containing protein [Chromatiales bacterium]|nr:SIMPL domain-containing protein [Chromatiales bacterium]